MSVAQIDRTQVVLRSGSVGVGGASVAMIEVTQVTQGLTGPSGGSTPGTGDSNYVHPQSSPSALWTVNHGLGKFPSVSVVDSANDEVEGSVRHISVNQLTITFSAPFSGRAFIN